MVKFYFSLLFLAFSFCLVSQTYPYLNASTGNENDFPVDKDTNIYMFHGNRLVKTDKNFNTVWANTYGSIYFKSILISKTGTIYFTARTSSPNTIFGKIGSTGNILWVKTTQNMSAISGTSTVNYTMDCQRLFLDRNNNLIVTGGEGFSSGKGFLIKSDTNGTILKFKVFNGPGYLDKFTIIDDSLGYYKIVGCGYQSMGPSTQLVLHTYSDISDAFTNIRFIYALGIPSYFGYKLIKSKYTSSFYLQTSTQSSSGIVYAGVTKFDANGLFKWARTYSNFNGAALAYSNYLEEFDKDKMYYSLTTFNYFNNYTSGFFQIDSTGSSVNTATTMLTGYYVFDPITIAMYIPDSYQRAIHSNNYFFDVSKYNFPSNPLTVQKFNSTLLLPCSSTATFNIANGTIGFSALISNPPIIPITSFTIPALSSTITSVPFSVNPNFCTVLNTNEIEKEKRLEIYPNPTNDKLYFNKEINEALLFEVNGKEIRSVKNVSNIAIADLPQGIYFIRIKTDKGEYNKKFIKE